MDKKKYLFFGSKLNTALLLVLIVLMVIALRFMFKNSQTYFPFLNPQNAWNQSETEAYSKYQKSLLTVISGNKDDLLSFSIAPATKVHGILSYRGVIKGGYFFEGNILINILDLDRNVLKASNAVAKGDWMTAGPVEFEGNIDFAGLPKGQAYLEIHNDNPSDIRANDKLILIPIIIE